LPYHPPTSWERGQQQDEQSLLAVAQNCPAPRGRGICGCPPHSVEHVSHPGVSPGLGTVWPINCRRSMTICDLLLHFPFQRHGPVAPCFLRPWIRLDNARKEDDGDDEAAEHAARFMAGLQLTSTPFHTHPTPHLRFPGVPLRAGRLDQRWQNTAPASPRPRHRRVLSSHH
jgi:hypothetical protein